MKNRLHRFSQNKPGPRYGHKYLLNIKLVTIGWWLYVLSNA